MSTLDRAFRDVCCAPPAAPILGRIHEFFRRRPDLWDHLYLHHGFAVREFCLFAVMKVAERDVETFRLRPSAPVDAVWHDFLLEQPAYDDFSASVCRARVLFHSTTRAFDSNRTECYRRTLLAYHTYFGIAAPSNVWPNEPLHVVVSVKMLARPGGICIRCHSSDTIGSLKETLQEVACVRKEMLMLADSNGNNIFFSDESSLADCGLSEGETTLIYCHIKAKGC